MNKDQKKLIRILKRYKKYVFNWSPDHGKNMYSKEQLIEELKIMSPIGERFLRVMPVERYKLVIKTMKREIKEINKKIKKGELPEDGHFLLKGEL